MKDNFQYFADLARWMQEESERAVIYLFNSYYQSYPIDNVGYAGGLALNSVINGKLKKSTPFKNFYFQPAANDSGLSIGCCYYGWLEVLKNKKTEFSQKNNFGKIYNEKEILNCLNKFSSKITFKKIDNVEFETASLLSEGKVIALFNGSSEFGPRALGNRSILADPRINGMDDYINKEIKSREDFRPFAPSVLEEDLNEYFILDYLKSPHMLLVGLVKEKYREQLPAITHIDGTARIQTVNKSDNIKYYTVLKHFKSITGMGVILNTSFNDKGMPIVETPDDALNFFVTSKIDVLVIENYVIERIN